MAISPQIEVCLSDDCTKLEVTDTTGVYDANDNTGGWGSPNISGSDVDTAEIIINDPDGNKTTKDVTSQVPNSVSGDFTYDPIEGTYPDGKYCIKYHIVAQEDETLPSITFSRDDGSIADGVKFTVEVDTTGDGNVDTTIGSYTTSGSESREKIYNELESDINNNSNFSATHDVSNNEFTVTAPSGTGSTYNGRKVEINRDDQGSPAKEGDMSGGSDALDVDETYKTCDLFTCHTRCCIEKMKAKIPEEICYCDHEPFIDDYIMASGLFRGARAAFGCDDVTKANEMLKRVRRLCDFNNCDC